MCVCVCVCVADCVERDRAWRQEAEDEVEKVDQKRNKKKSPQSGGWVRDSLLSVCHFLGRIRALSVLEALSHW